MHKFRFDSIVLKACSMALIICAAGSVQAKGVAQSAEEKAFYTSVHEALNRDQWAKCLTLCEAYLPKHKSDLLARAIRGYALLENNKDAHAVADLNAALAGGVKVIPVSIAEDHSNNVLALRGFALMRTGKLKEGIADIEKAVSKEPLLIGEYLNQRIDFNNLATAYRRLGDARKAAHFMQLADNREKEIQFVYLPTFGTRIDIERDTKRLRKTLAITPNNNVANAKLCANLIYLKNYPEALKYIDKTVAIEPYLTRVRLMRYEILEKLGRAKEAAGDIDEVLHVVERPSGSALAAGDRMMLSSRLIEIYKKAGNLDGQIKVFEAVVNSGSAGESQYYDLGQCYAAKKQWAKAIGAYDDALEFAVDNRPLIFEQRARAHKMLGHAREAKADEDQSYRLRHKGGKN